MPDIIEKKVTTKKVIFLLPILGGGGGERVVSDLSWHLPKSIEKVIVAFEVRGHYRYDGRIIPLGIKLSTNPVLKILIFLKGYVKLKKIIAQEQPDHIISFGSLQNIINILASKNAIVRIDNPILISHTRPVEKLYPIFVRFLFNKAKRIIVVSNGLKKELVGKFNITEAKISVIYNSVDIEAINRLSQEPLEPIFEELFNKHPVIINIGSLIAQKDQESLIAAFGEVKKEIPAAKLVILGEGVLEAHLKGLAEKLELEHDIYFLGWQQNPFKFLARSKLFVLSSFWEGFGIVILEAMACGVPVISTDCQFGPREIVSPDSTSKTYPDGIENAEYGVLLPVYPENRQKRQEHLTKAMIKVLSDANLQKRLIAQAKERVGSFDMKANLYQYSFLQEAAKKISWVFIDRKVGGGFAYNNEVRNILSRHFTLQTIAIEDRHFAFKYIKPIFWFWKIISTRTEGDILIEESFDTILFPSARKSPKKVAIIHHIDNSASPFFLQIPLFFAEKLFYRHIKKFDLVVTVSEYWRQYFLNLGCKNVAKIYNSFDIEQFSVTDEEVQNFKKKYHLLEKPIIYIGNCQKAKGVVGSYQALKNLPVYLVTSGERKVQIPAINLHLDYREYLCLLKSSLVVVTMSRFKEGWCRTAHEAMLLKRPVIGSGAGGMEELLLGGGQVVCKDFSRLQENVRRLLDNQGVAEAMGRQGFAYAKGFTKTKFADSWENVMADV